MPPSIITHPGKLCGLLVLSDLDGEVKVADLNMEIPVGEEDWEESCCQ